MHPIFIYIGSRPIYWYGVMMAVAFLAGVLHWRFIGRREGRDAAFCSDLALWIMIAGILGARVAYVLSNLDEYLAHPLTIIRIDQGGLVYYGGFLGAGLGLMIFARIRRQKLLPLLDFVVTALPLGHAIGRIGCFLNGCCYGIPCRLPWGVEMEGAVRHPVQIYEAAANFLLYLLLIPAYRRRKRDGTVLTLYLLTYPVCRFFFEFLRGDDDLRLCGLREAQCVSIVLFIIGCGFWLWQRRSHDAAQRRTG